MWISRLLNSRNVGGVANWLGILGPLVSLSVVGALLSWAATAFDSVYQHGWGAVVFAGLAGACVLILTLSIAALAMRPWLPTRSFPAPNQVPIEEAEGSDSKQTIQWIGDIQRTLGAATENSSRMYDDFNERFRFISQRFGELKERFALIEKMLAPSSTRTPLQALGMVAPPPTNRLESIDVSIEALENRVTAYERTLDGLYSEFSQKLDKLNQDTHDSFQTVCRAINARNVYQTYKNMAKNIDQKVENLSDPLSKPEFSNDWDNWDGEFLAFKSQVLGLEQFLETHARIATKFFDTPTEQYASSNWSYDFGSMTDDQKMNYKTFRLIVRNFEDERPSIRSKLYNATFVSI